MDDLPKSSRRWQPDESLTVSYQPAMKLLLLLSPLLIIPFFMLFLEEGVFFLEMLCVAALVYCCWVIADSLLTRSFTFFPEKIVKYGILGQTEIPSNALLMYVKDQDITLLHGSDKNVRESMKIRRFLIGGTDVADILKYVKDIYKVHPNEVWQHGYPEHRKGINQLAVMEFGKAASSYRTMAAFFAVIAVLAIFTVGFSDSFFGLAPWLPAYPIRLVCIGLALAAFFPLRSWASIPTRVSLFELVPVMTRLERADSYAFRSATLAVLVAGLGLLLFFCFGNTLDLYLFLLVGLLYFYDCYPRLSTWECLSRGKDRPEVTAETAKVLPRRSLQVSLALMGALAVMSYGESSHYLYANLKDCQDDWGDGTECREAPNDTSSSGGGHIGARYYGPRIGWGGGRPTHAMGIGSVSRGGFGKLGGFHASFGG